MRHLSRKALYGLAGCCIVGVLAILFQLGPPGIKSGDYRVLASLRLTNNLSLHLVAHRCGGLTDPYDVYLYKVQAQSNVFVCGIDSETAYWWGASLRLIDSNRVEIRAEWTPEAYYYVQDGTVSLVGRIGFTFVPRLIDVTNMVYPIPAGVR